MNRSDRRRASKAAAGLGPLSDRAYSPDHDTQLARLRELIAEGMTEATLSAMVDRDTMIRRSVHEARLEGSAITVRQAIGHEVVALRAHGHDGVARDLLAFYRVVGV